MASIDSVEALSLLIAQYQGFVIPFLVGLSGLIANIKGGTPPEMLRNCKDFLYFQAVQVFCIHFLIFVSWKKGPQWWLKIAPSFFMGQIVLTYILIPIAICILTDMRWASIQEDIFFLQIFVSFGCQLSHLVHFYLTVYKKVLPEAKAYIKKRERRRILDEQLGSPTTRANNNNGLEFEN